jgi:hypothetical protein
MIQESDVRSQEFSIVGANQCACLCSMRGAPLSLTAQ